MIVEGYTIHLYCDDPDHPWDVVYRPGEFAGHRIADAFREARADGWTFFQENDKKKCRCPGCTARQKP
jgi:hypothetical protein